MFSKKCYNGGSKHKFEPRYDEKDSGLASRLTKIKGYFNRELLYYNVYIHDICVWCGNVIKREKV